MSFFVYSVLGSRPEVNVGPNIVTALFCKPLVDEYGPDIIFTFCLYTGVLVAVIGVLNLGELGRGSSSQFDIIHQHHGRIWLPIWGGGV